MQAKYKFLKDAIVSGAPMDKEWVFRCSSIVKNTKPVLDDYYPHKEGDNWVYYEPDGEESIVIAPYKSGTPLFSRDEALVITPDILPSVGKKEITTTWGVLLLNLLVFWYPFKERAPFWNKSWDPSDIDDYWANEAINGNMTIDQLLLSSAGASQLTAFNTLFTPSYTERTTRICPAALKRLNELLKERESQLADPAAVAEILEEVYKIDKAWIEEDKDGGAGFLISAKSYRVVRMHLLYTHILHGAPGRIATPSLRDGLVVDKLPAAINESMKGSLDRGFNTALGGVAVKEILRLLALITVKVADCKTKIGLRRKLTKDDKVGFEGRYIIKGESLVKLTKENISDYIGKEVIMRDPTACKAEAFCGICVGGVLAANPEGIKGQGIEWGSVMVGLFMAAMHGKSLVTEDYDIEASLS